MLDCIFSFDMVCAHATVCLSRLKLPVVGSTRKMVKNLAAPVENEEPVEGAAAVEEVSIQWMPFLGMFTFTFQILTVGDTYCYF